MWSLIANTSMQSYARNPESSLFKWTSLMSEVQNMEEAQCCMLSITEDETFLILF